jgi:predicted RNase H-like HicB family nuclease
MGIMNVVGNVDMNEQGEREPTWDEAVAAFEAAEPVELVRSPRKIVVTYRYADGSFVATSPALTGFEVAGSSLHEARLRAKEALAAYLDPVVEVVERFPHSPIETAGVSRGSIGANPPSLIFEPSSHSASRAFVSSRSTRASRVPS